MHFFFCNFFLHVPSRIQLIIIFQELIIFKTWKKALSYDFYQRQHTKGWVWTAPKIRPTWVLLLMEPYCSWIHVPSPSTAHFLLNCSVTIHSPLNACVLREVMHQSWQQATLSPSEATHPETTGILWLISPSFNVKASSIASSNFSRCLSASNVITTPSSVWFWLLPHPSFRIPLWLHHPHGENPW